MRQTSKARTIGLVLFIVVVLISVAALLIRKTVGDWTDPWFGRGANLRACPYRTLVGPVDMNRGVVGVLEIGMPKATVQRNLGKPIVAAMSAAEVRKQPLLDLEDVDDDYYDGVFAWVSYDRQNRVSMITFDLDGFSCKFRGHQTVVLTHGKQTYLLNDTVTQDQAITMLRSIKGVTPLWKGKGFRIVIVGTGVDLFFDDLDGSITKVCVSSMGR